LGKDKLQISYWVPFHIHDLSGKGIKAIVDEFLAGRKGKEENNQSNESKRQSIKTIKWFFGHKFFA
jgi:hypothetical protein